MLASIGRFVLNAFSKCLDDLHESPFYKNMTLYDMINL